MPRSKTLPGCSTRADALRWLRPHAGIGINERSKTHTCSSSTLCTTTTTIYVDIYIYRYIVCSRVREEALRLRRSSPRAHLFCRPPSHLLQLTRGKIRCENCSVIVRCLCACNERAGVCGGAARAGSLAALRHAACLACSLAPAASHLSFYSLVCGVRVVARERKREKARARVLPLSLSRTREPRDFPYLPVCVLGAFCADAVQNQDGSVFSPPFCHQPSPCCI